MGEVPKRRRDGAAPVSQVDALQVCFEGEQFKDLNGREKEKEEFRSVSLC